MTPTIPSLTGSAPSISPDSIVVASQEQVSCELEGEAAILNLKDGAYYGLNEVGAAVWKLIQGPRAVGAIREELLKEYEVDSVRCEQDLVELLSELASLGMVEVRGGPDG